MNIHVKMKKFLLKMDHVNLVKKVLTPGSKDKRNVGQISVQQIRSFFQTVAAKNVNSTPESTTSVNVNQTPVPTDKFYLKTESASIVISLTHPLMNLNSQLMSKNTLPKENANRVDAILKRNFK
jgi:DNA-binding transcriptional regulator GbsR (MarR family)